MPSSAALHARDELFVRGADGMQPTARAAEIGPRLRQALDHMQLALAPSAFDPKTTGPLLHGRCQRLFLGRCCCPRSRRGCASRRPMPSSACGRSTISTSSRSSMPAAWIW
ncbi:MAG: hypothetical protein WDO24_22235 [Pseudomonadota bacterium]